MPSMSTRGTCGRDVRLARRPSLQGWRGRALRGLLASALSLAGLALVLPADAEAKAKRKPAKAKKTKVKRITKASEQTQKGITALLGKLKFGMSVDEVKNIVAARIQQDFNKKMKEAKGDALVQDKLRADLTKAVAEYKKKYYVFEGKKTGWEVSILDQEFAHHSGESMLEGLDEARQRRYYFFQNGKLWKMFIAFKSDTFKGLNFDQFAQRIQERYGRANPITKTDKYSKKEFLAFLEWPVAGKNQLRAIDRSTHYDSFCLLLSDKSVEDRLKDVRKDNAVAGKPTRDGLVEGILRSGDDSDANQNVVDQITGRAADGDAPELPKMTSENAGGPQVEKAKAKKKKR
jgi:hypothetical protein